MNDKKFLTLNQYNIIGQKNEIDFNEIKKYEKLEELIIKNYEINDEIFQLIDSLEKLKSVSLINCTIKTTKTLSKIETLELDNCIIRKSLFSSNIKNLYIQNCSNIDICDFENLNLKSLRIENTKTTNLNKIDEFIELENLYLNEIDLNVYINYDKLINLKRLNLNGSTVVDKDKFLKQFENRNIEISFTKENNRIG